MKKSIFGIAIISCLFSSCDKTETRYYLVTSNPSGIEKIQREYIHNQKEANIEDIINSISYRVSKESGKRLFIVDSTPDFSTRSEDKRVMKMMEEARHKADENFLDVDFSLFEIEAKQSQLEYFEKGLKELEKGNIPKNKISEKFEETPVIKIFPVPINDLIVINTFDSLINEKEKKDKEVDDYINSHD